MECDRRQAAYSVQTEFTGAAITVVTNDQFTTKTPTR
jgi:hypothetical protein